VFLDGSDAEMPSAEVAKYVDSSAYVTGGMLVANFWRFPVGGLQPRSRGILTAHIIEKRDAQGSTWSLADGTVAGQFKIDDMLGLLHGLRDVDTGQPLCTDARNYRAYKEHFCSIADISSFGTDPLWPCDAVSWAWKFNADPALLEGVDFTVLKDDCPADDHCDTLE